MNAEAIEHAIDEQVKLARLKESMARDCFLDVHDLAKRYGRSPKTIYKLPIPRTKVKGTAAVLFDPRDVLACEERERIGERVRPEHIEALASADDPVLADLRELLSDIVG